ncbi:hypothetical protein PSTEL_01540 [Paenibacillus stellifer]|uniref:Uncharacterized protein n=1 Tax=Paenibacillus stellifer TaxID=169760 RepID=A0A089LKE8_9BACL|nr:hypothetical protein PSTEL_01540 [Paenibacillus stellifer]
MRRHLVRVAGPGEQRIAGPARRAAAFARCMRIRVEREGLEGAVLHKLRIDAAVRRVVDVFIEQAVHDFADIGDFFIAVDGQRIGRHVLRNDRHLEALLQRAGTPGQYRRKRHCGSGTNRLYLPAVKERLRLAGGPVDADLAAHQRLRQRHVPGYDIRRERQVFVAGQPDNLVIAQGVAHDFDHFILG